MCVDNGIVAREYSILSIRFNTCMAYFKVESKITRDFAAQCSLFTYTLQQLVFTLKHSHLNPLSQSMKSLNQNINTGSKFTSSKILNAKLM